MNVIDLEKKRIIFQEPGMDGYWSNDGDRLIYSALGHDSGVGGVSIWHYATGDVTRQVAPPNLGDNYSWSSREGQDLILTIAGNYFVLREDHAVLPAGHIPVCPDLGAAERPLISHDGRRITAFRRGTVVVRALTDCHEIFDTGMRGAKADFSFDGRYIAFHVPKDSGNGSDIDVVDLEEHTVRNLTARLPGDSLFPSWTKDGRLSFRYEGSDFRGFVLASGVLDAPARPLPTADHLEADRRWNELFPETAPPHNQLSVVLIWGTWSAHSAAALAALAQAQHVLELRGYDVATMTALEPGTLRFDAEKISAEQETHFRLLPLSPEHFRRTEASNQIPATLLFRGERLVASRLGALSSAELVSWLSDEQNKKLH
jgi:hypothetical protein